jgi:hypothetical protein
MKNNQQLIDDFISFKKISNRSIDGNLRPRTVELYCKNLEYLSNSINNKSFKKVTESEILKHLNKLFKERTIKCNQRKRNQRHKQKRKHKQKKRSLKKVNKSIRL